MFEEIHEAHRMTYILEIALKDESFDEQWWPNSNLSEILCLRTTTPISTSMFSDACAALNDDVYVRRKCMDYDNVVNGE